MAVFLFSCALFKDSMKTPLKSSQVKARKISNRKFGSEILLLFIPTYTVFILFYIIILMSVSQTV